MKWRDLPIVLIAAALSACGSGGFVSSWKAPDAEPLVVRGTRVGAVVMMQDEASRRTAEDSLARQIDAMGARGIPGYTVMLDNRPSTESEAKMAFERADVQGVVVIRPISASREISRPPVRYLEPSYNSYWGGYYGYGWDNTWGIEGAGASTVNDRVSLTFEILVYSLRQNKLVWAGRTRTSDSGGIVATIEKLSRAAATELQRQGLISE